nr:unnamed protein product [Callosobruchus analis]
MGCVRLVIAATAVALAVWAQWTGANAVLDRATSQTIRRWIKMGVRKSEMDTNIFKSDSTRHESTSAAIK